MQPGDTPVIIGAAQITEPWQSGAERSDPLGLMEKAARQAALSAGSTTLLANVDAVNVVNILSWAYADAPGSLAERLGAPAEERRYTPIGGNSPQVLVERAATELQSGRIKVALLAGAEAAASTQRAQKEGRDLGWPTMTSPQRIDGDDRLGASPIEFAYELTLPAAMYPLIETVFRARAGRSPAEHARFLGRLCERFSAVAADNPYAWFRNRRSAEEVATPTPDNRYVGYPYTKLMNSILAVDQAAVLIMTTEKTATDLGVDRSRWVYPMGSAAVNDVWYVTERPRLDRSPAIRAAAEAALAQAGASMSEVDTIDLYSCFPCAVQLGCEALDISVEDPRGLTVTGGLPYFGGPGNNYTMHSIATVVERIRSGKSRRALVTALGWYATKHAVGIYGTQPPERAWGTQDLRAVQAKIDATALPPPLEVFDGVVEVEAFVIRHRRDGSPRSGTVLGRSPQRARVLAVMDVEPDDLARLEESEVVGTRWTCRHDAGSGKNFVRPE